MSSETKNSSLKRGLTLNNATPQEALEKLIEDPLYYDFFDYTVMEINHFCNILESHAKNDSRWEMIDYNNSEYDIEGNITEERYTQIPMDLWDYFRESRWDNKYGNGQVPANLAIKVLMEDLGVKDIKDSTQDKYCEIMDKFYGNGTSENFINDFRESMEERYD